MNTTAKKFMYDVPYKSYGDYLEDLLIYDFLIFYHALGQGHVKEKAGKWLAGQEVDEDQEIMDWYDNLSSRKELAEIIGTDYPIDDIVSKMALNPFQQFVLGLSLLIQMDMTVRNILSLYLEEMDLSDLTIEVLLAIYYSDKKQTLYEKERLSRMASKELTYLFPDLAEKSAGIKCDQRLVDLILGIEDGLTQAIDIYQGESGLDKMIFREAIMETLDRFIGLDTYPLIMLVGERGSGKRHLVKHFVKKNKSGLVFFDAGIFKDDVSEMHIGLRLAVRECIVQTLPLAISGIEHFNQHDLDHFVEFVKNSFKPIVQLIFFLMEKEVYVTSRNDVYIIELEKFNDLERIEIWKHYSKGVPFKEDFSLETVANTFNITSGQIIGAIEQAKLYSHDDHLVSQEMLHTACYAQIDRLEDSKVTKVNASFTWDDLKLPESEKEIIREICDCVKNKHIVMNEWNFTKVVPYGAGVTVLFSGVPGTGKTMAAQVIANELKMELYKIDLSQLIDKYIGETEKNIKRVFEQAQKSNSILFFDEADAIFNKRIKAKSSNDRFANIESSLLLQCIEEYKGISILATNDMNAIDSAFIRRFKHYVLFREPNEGIRYEIWQSVFPDQAPLDGDVDLKVLSKTFAFTGGVIKNVALSAAYLAAEKGGAISIVDILKSVKKEMFKNSLILTKEKLGPLGYLYDEIN